MRPAVASDLGLSFKAWRRRDSKCQGEYPARISSLYAYAPRRSSVVAFPTPTTCTATDGQPQRPVPARGRRRRTHLGAFFPTLHGVRPSLACQTWALRADVSKCRCARKCIARRSGRVLRYQDIPKRRVLRQNTPTGISLLTDKDISEPCYRSPAAGRR
jgi:hypothetical protein